MKNPKKDVLKKLRKILKENPQGLWVREIERQSGLNKSTISRYLVGMKNVEFHFMGRNKVYSITKKEELK